MQWIDTHVHLFSDKKGNNEGVPLLKATGTLNTLDVYFDELAGNLPEGIVVVDFSKAKDSEHVINSLDELKDKKIKAAGIIKGNMDDSRTIKWLKRDDVKGIRLYALAGVPDVTGAAMSDVFSYIEKTGKHILTFGSPENLLKLIENIPSAINVLIDHLGLPCIEKEDASYKQLLKAAKARGNVYFKGPGYRTSLDIEKTIPILKQIIGEVGADRLLLGASDAPFAGPVMEKTAKYAGQNYCDLIGYDTVLDYINALAQESGDAKKVLYTNAKELYGF